MIEKDTTVVLTTINPPNPKIRKWAEISKNKVMVIGDNKTPVDWKHEDCEFISIDAQKQEPLRFQSAFLKITTREKTLVISTP